MNFRNIIIANLFFVVCFIKESNGQEDYRWSMGMEFSFFEFDMAYKELWEMDRWYKKSYSGNQGISVGLLSSIPISDHFNVQFGLSMSKQKYKYFRSTRDDSNDSFLLNIPGIDLFNNHVYTELNYMHLPVRINYSTFLDRFERFGMEFGFGLILSYCNDYLYINKYYQQIFDPINGRYLDEYWLASWGEGNPKSINAVFYYQDGRIASKHEIEPKFFSYKRFNLGGEFRMGFFGIIGERYKIRADFFYSRDFFNLARADFEPTTKTSFDYNMVFIKRMGAQISLEYRMF